jgi:hypothetical protein
MKKRGRNYDSYLDPRNLLKMLTRSSSRYVSDKPKDGKPIKYCVFARKQFYEGPPPSISETFTRKSEAKAFRNKLNHGPGGGPYRVTTLGK